MKLKQKLLISVFLLTSMFTYSQVSTFGKMSYEKAVNLSGKQRMLSQKIAKVVLLKKAGADTPALKAELKSSITLFERNLKILGDNSIKQSSKVKAMLRNEAQEWGKLKLAIAKPNLDVDLLLSMSESLLGKCHNLVLAIEEDSKFNKELGYSTGLDQLKVETINKAGKQRMMSQRLCLYYTACKIFKKGKKADIACIRYQNIYNEMNGALNNLLVNELNNTQIDLVLADILNLTEIIDSKKKDFNENSLPLGEMIASTNKMLDLFNKATSLYSL